MFTREELHALAIEAVENGRKLNSCSRHRFPRCTAEHCQVGAKITCELCDGTMRTVNAQLYVKGYIAAGRSSDDVWPGLNDTITTTG